MILAGLFGAFGSRVRTTKGRTSFRGAVSALLLATLLAPVAWAGPTWADDFTDDAGPTDNPRTPEPDLYANWKADLGIGAMPDLAASLQGAAPLPGPLPGPSGHCPSPARPDAPSPALLPLRSSRAPPSV